MLSLYPDIEPYNHFMLDVELPHKLYIEESGNPKGLPVLFIHGGPGAGCFAQDRCFFDPDVYRIVLFDQRGAGRSTPHACLENNSTDKLIEDIETIREHLGIQQWVVFGGSWGSTLSLAYAQTHPEAVLGLIVRGIFLVKDADIEWFYGTSGTANVFPEHYQDFLAPLPHGIQKGIVEDYYEQLTSEDEIRRLAAAKAWSIWEGRTATLNPNPYIMEAFSNPHMALSIARIECHYFLHHGFLKANQLLDNMPKISSKPGVIIHGRYDMICPVKNAWDLHQTWPASTLKIIREAGHASREPGILDALIRATNELGEQLTR